MDDIGPQRVEDVWGQGCKKLIFDFVAGHVETPNRAKRGESIQRIWRFFWGCTVRYRTFVSLFVARFNIRSGLGFGLRRGADAAQSSVAAASPALVKPSSVLLPPSAHLRILPAMYRRILCSSAPVARVLHANSRATSILAKVLESKRL